METGAPSDCLPRDRRRVLGSPERAAPRGEERGFGWRASKTSRRRSAGTPRSRPATRRRLWRALADDIEWITPGNSAISGTVRGKEAVGALWARFAEKGFTTTPQFWFSDEERVVVLTHTTIEGGESDACDVLTFRGGKVVKFQTSGDTALAERVFGTK